MLLSGLSARQPTVAAKGGRRPPGGGRPLSDRFPSLSSADERRHQAAPRSNLQS